MTPPVSRSRRRFALGAALGAVFLAFAAFVPVVRAGPQDSWTLMQILIESINATAELKRANDAIGEARDNIRDVYEIYDTGRNAVEALQSYSHDEFLEDMKHDFYNLYPNFEYLVEGPRNKRLDAWVIGHRQGRRVDPYDLIGATFGDLAQPVKDRSRVADLLGLERALIWRHEAAGSLQTLQEIEQATRKSQKSLAKMYADGKLVGEADAAVNTQRLLAVIATQQALLIRLQANQLRLAGIEGAMAYGDAAEGFNVRFREAESIAEFVATSGAGSALMTFD